MTEAYFLGYATVRRLRALAQTDDVSAAIARLEEFAGTENDVKTVSDLCRSVDKHDLAAEILMLLP